MERNDSQFFVVGQQYFIVTNILGFSGKPVFVKHFEIIGFFLSCIWHVNCSFISI